MSSNRKAIRNSQQNYNRASAEPRVRSEDLDWLSDAVTGADALVTVNGGQEIRSGAFLWTPVGLQAEGDISRDDWELTGQLLQRVDASIQWLIGDWINAADAINYGEAENFASELGFNVKTIYEYAYVSRKVEISIRMENLSFSHHQLVAAMEPEEQEKWLKRAAEEGISVAKLRAAIKENDNQTSETLTPVQAMSTRISQQRETILKRAKNPKQRQDYLRLAQDEAKRWAELARHIENMNEDNTQA